MLDDAGFLAPVEIQWQGRIFRGERFVKDGLVHVRYPTPYRTLHLTSADAGAEPEAEARRLLENLVRLDADRGHPQH